MPGWSWRCGLSFSRSLTRPMLSSSLFSLSDCAHFSKRRNESKRPRRAHTTALDLDPRLCLRTTTAREQHQQQQRESMGQTTSVQEDKMAKRIRQSMGSFVDFGHHIKRANEWYAHRRASPASNLLCLASNDKTDVCVCSRCLVRARLCPTPKTCHLAFRIVVNDRISAEILPYVWRVRGNVSSLATHLKCALRCFGLTVCTAMLLL